MDPDRLSMMVSSLKESLMIKEALSATGFSLGRTGTGWGQVGLSAGWDGWVGGGAGAFLVLCPWPGPDPHHRVTPEMELSGRGPERPAALCPEALPPAQLPSQPSLTPLPSPGPAHLGWR